MAPTISKFRQDLFTYVDSAAQGEVVEFTHKGTRFQLIRPDNPPVDKLKRITPLSMDILSSSPSELVKAHKKMSQEITRDWEAGWDK